MWHPEDAWTHHLSSYKVPAEDAWSAGTSYPSGVEGDPSADDKIIPHESHPPSTLQGALSTEKIGSFFDDWENASTSSSVLEGDPFPASVDDEVITHEGNLPSEQQYEWSDEKFFRKNSTENHLGKTLPVGYCEFLNYLDKHNDEISVSQINSIIKKTEYTNFTACKLVANINRRLKKLKVTYKITRKEGPSKNSNKTIYHRSPIDAKTEALNCSKRR